MEMQIVYLALAALALGLALNLKLTLSVLRASRRERETPAAFVSGQRVRALEARTLVGRARVQLVEQGQPWVLLFLSSQCPKCRGKLPEIEQMFPVVQQAGLTMWLVSQERPWRLRRFLRGTSLHAHVARLGLDPYRTLNPMMSAPAYLFVSHEGALEATGLIGDENWLSLRTQLGFDEPEQQAA